MQPKVFIILLFAIACSTRTGKGSDARAPALSEYDIKAALLYKFIPFVEWPETNAKHTSLTIGVVGDNPFGNTLNAISEAHMSEPALVIKYYKPDEIKLLQTCQILFIAENDIKKLQRILHATSGLPILTVGDSKGFTENGGMIGFVTKSNRLAFEINSTEVKKAKLEIRSTLMRLAVRVLKE